MKYPYPFLKNSHDVHTRERLGLRYLEDSARKPRMGLERAHSIPQKGQVACTLGASVLSGTLFFSFFVVCNLLYMADERLGPCRRRRTRLPAERQRTAPTAHSRSLEVWCFSTLGINTCKLREHLILPVRGRGLIRIRTIFQRSMCILWVFSPRYYLLLLLRDH